MKRLILIAGMFLIGQLAFSQTKDGKFSDRNSGTTKPTTVTRPTQKHQVVRDDKKGRGLTEEKRLHAEEKSNGNAFGGNKNSHLKKEDNRLKKEQKFTIREKETKVKSPTGKRPE